MRHAHFAIGEAERDAWLRHMRAALDEIGLGEPYDAQLWEYLVMAAHSLVNQPSARAATPTSGSARPDARRPGLSGGGPGWRRQPRVSRR
jgi:hemoglobin